MKLKRLCLLSGAPGSGKSTWAREYVKNNPEVAYISRDEIRMEMLNDGDRYFDKEKAVFREYARRAKEALQDGAKTVILDATHINFPSVRKILVALNWVEDFTIIRFHIPLNILLERNAGRTGRACVPEEGVRRMYNSTDDPEVYCNNVYWINKEGEVYRG